MLLEKQINKQTKKYVATLALNEYLLSRREVSYSASISSVPKKLEKKWEIKRSINKHYTWVYTSHDGRAPFRDGGHVFWPVRPKILKNK